MIFHAHHAALLGSRSRGGFLLAKAIILALFLPVYLYLLTCRVMSFHYDSIQRKLAGIGLDKCDSMLLDSENKIFHSGREWCEAQRYIVAGGFAVDHMGFDVIDMARNWNHDFLADAPACAPKETKP